MRIKFKISRRGRAIRVRSIFFVFIISFCGLLSSEVLTSCGSKGRDVPEYIEVLDHLIESPYTYEKEKLVRIDDLRHRLSSARTSAEKYAINSLLFDEYSTYVSDSALKYIDANIALAQAEGNKEWLNNSKIKKADYYTATGMLTHSYDLLASIDRSDLSNELLTDYYGQMIYLYSHLGNYVGSPGNDYYVKERMYKDSIMTVINPSHPDYLWYKGLDILGTDQPTEEIIAELRENLKDSRMNTQAAAKNAFLLGKLYEQNGDKKNYERYMALSAAADIRFYNQRELSSLEELSRILYDDGNGDISRAFRYASYCLECALSYPNRVKVNGISNALGEVNQEYERRLLEEQSDDRHALVAICILAGVLAGAIVVNIILYLRQHRQKVSLDLSNKSLNEKVEELSRSQKMLHDANRQLQQLNNDLKQKNDELDEANYVKEEYICNIFSLCSALIGKLSELKKEIHINLLAKKYQEISRLTEDFDMREEIKDFYRSFDAIFLHIYPDFVKDFNTLLQEGKKIYPKDGELLNTELRIYALIRLGITDSVKIAEFLHCSPQTVYNNRFKVRNKAIIAKEDFAAAVKKLGRYVDSGA